MLPLKTRYIVFLFLFGICIQNAIYSQDDAHSEYWGSISMRKYLPNNKYWLRNDFGVQHANGEYPSTMLLWRPRMIINIGNYFDIHPAVDLRYTISKESVNVLEIRTWQGVGVDWPQIKRVMFDHFYRFEQRIYYYDSKRQDDVGLRSRYRLRMRIPINNKAVSDKTLYVDLQGEAFIPHDDNIDELFANRFRLGVNIGYNQNQKWRYYLTSYVDRGRNNYNNDVTNDRFIFSLTVRRTLF